jgi:hypothetical protein
MRMPTDTRRNLACLSLIGLALMVIVFIAFLVSCATFTNFFSHQETFDLTIGIETYTMVLPQDFPDMKDAVVSADRCWDALICQKAFCTRVIKPHDHIHFWYVPGKAPVALVWVREQETDINKKYKAWLYIKGVPVPADLKQINDFLEGIFLGSSKKGGISWSPSYSI